MTISKTHPVDLILRTTYREVCTVLLKSFSLLLRVEMKSLVGKKGIPALADEVLVSFGIAALPLYRGENNTIARFNTPQSI